MALLLAGYLLGAVLTLGIILWAVRGDGGRLNVPRLIVGVALWPGLWLLTLGLEIMTLIDPDPPQG